MMKNSTGLTPAQFTHVLDRVTETDIARELPNVLGLHRALMAVFIYLRTNRTQAEIAEQFGVSQPSINRSVTKLTPVIAEVLADQVPTIDEIPTDTTHLVDGTLLPCWSWRNHPELYSGKHHTTGVNIQVVTSLTGSIVWVSDPLPGSTHDVTAIDTHHLLDGRDPTQFIADKGYLGRGMTTPERKPATREISEETRNYNTAINKLRWPVEQAIAHLKTWRILHTDYRRPYTTLKTTLKAVLGLYFLTA